VKDRGQVINLVPVTHARYSGVTSREARAIERDGQNGEVMSVSALTRIGELAGDRDGVAKGDFQPRLILLRSYLQFCRPGKPASPSHDRRSESNARPQQPVQEPIDILILVIEQEHAIAE